MKILDYFYERFILGAPFIVVRVRTIYKREGTWGLIKNIIRRFYRKILSILDPSSIGRLQFKDWQKNIEKRYLNKRYIEDLCSYVGNKKKFSIIFPVWNTPQAVIHKTLTSVVNQYYKNWELCISDGSIKKVKETREFLRKFQQENPKKVKLNFLKNPSEIKKIEISNSAIAKAEGDFCIFLDCDDEISPNCLLELALVVKQKTEVDFIYSDFDKIDSKGNRSDPSFWPDWSPFTILSQMYTAHVTCYRTELLKKLAGLRTGTEGAQDWDLVLRLSEQTDKIVHIPKILYHRRIHIGSTAPKNKDNGAKDLALKAQKKILFDWTKRNNLNAEVVEGAFQDFWRIKYGIKNSPKVSIIIPFRDKVFHLEKCLKSIFEKTTYENYEIVLINNRSIKKSTLVYLKTVSKMEKIKVLNYDQVFHFGKLNNWAVEHVDGEYVLLLNNDVKVKNDGWLKAMLEYAQLPEVGEVGAKLFYPDGTIQHVGIGVGLGGAAAHPHRKLEDDGFGFLGWLANPRNVFAVTAACMLIKRKLFLEIGGFDPQFDPAYQDVDFGIRLYEKGYWNIYTPYARLCHYESVTRFAKDYTETLTKDEENAVKLRKKWPQYVGIDFGADPFYNPNLSYDHEDLRFKTFWYPEDWGKRVGLIFDFNRIPHL